jgi:predicted O-methyltransferase YrrM
VGLAVFASASKVSLEAVVERKVAAGTGIDYAPWFASGTFTSDWSSEHFDLWARILADRRGEPLDILEIGSFEGRSATFFLEYLPKSSIVCIDRFFSASDPGYDVRFRNNVRRFGRRVEALRAESMLALHALLPNRRRFDLIYVDGGHARDDVLMDSLLSWRLLKAGGILIWDDYELLIAPNDGPKEAIDTVLRLFEGHYEELYRGWQIIIRKTAEKRSFFRSRPAFNGLTLRRFVMGRIAPRTPANLLRLLLGRLG